MDSIFLEVFSNLNDPVGAKGPAPTLLQLHSCPGQKEIPPVLGLTWAVTEAKAFENISPSKGQGQMSCGMCCGIFSPHNALCAAPQNSLNICVCVDVNLFTKIMWSSKGRSFLLLPRDHSINQCELCALLSAQCH